MSTLEFQGHKDPGFRVAVEEKAGRGEKVRLNYRRGMGGGLNAMGFEFRAYRKTTLTFAAQMHADFEVDTLEGTHTGKAGDWLAVGAAGEMYPIDAAVFDSSYSEAVE